MKILITGGNGQLGTELQRILKDGKAEIGTIPSAYSDAEVVATDYSILDVTNREAVLNFVADSCFDLIINCAAITNVDGCENDSKTAFLVNGQGPSYLSEAADNIGAKIVHISTDYVYSGLDSRPRIESDEPNPLSVYGSSKLAGERAVLDGCEKHFVIRTAWLYGYVGKNFVKTMMSLGEKFKEITVVNDQFGNPTSANDLAYGILCIAQTDNYGIYHCTNEGTCSWFDFATTIMQKANLDCKVVGCTSEEYLAKNPASAKRPAYSSLVNKHLEDTIGNKMRPWQDALDTYFENLASQEG
ncbi:MAG: dTDP-4-dehydrorhamnose reductase [Gordonibacter sp.]|uniref:dTDP-4-dehydrorhamnose reductase n=1 Tax=Gordonibacter sp. TaxID=1968902 RepID=UPI00321F7361